MWVEVMDMIVALVAFIGFPFLVIAAGAGLLVLFEPYPPSRTRRSLAPPLFRAVPGHGTLRSRASYNATWTGINSEKSS